MAALSITAANVALVSGPETPDQIAGAAFVAGTAVYFDPTTGRWSKAVCNGTATQAGLYGLGIALATADAAGARVSIARAGAIVALGAGVSGTTYHVGSTAGAINPAADITTGMNSVPLAHAIGSNNVMLLPGYDGAVV